MTEIDSSFLDDDDLQHGSSSLHRHQGNSTNLLIHTIENMTHPHDLNRFRNSFPSNASTVCANPIHFHSLTKPSGFSSIIKSKFRVCAVCNLRISIISGDVVTCLACGIFLHRTCTGTWKDKDVPHCSVNLAIIHERESKIKIEGPSCMEHVPNDPLKEEVECCCDSSNSTDNISNATDAISMQENEQDEDDHIWSASGPPAHWALSSPEMLKGLKGSSVATEFSEQVQQEDNSTKTELEEIQDWKSSLSKLSLTLQQNLRIIKKQSEDLAAVDSLSEDQIDQEAHIHESRCKDESIESTKTMMRTVSERIQEQSDLKTIDQRVEEENGQDIRGVLSEVKSKPMSVSPKSSKSVQAIKDSVQIVKKGQQARKNMGVASIGGCIVGGVAGLIIAGPTGAYVGSKIGQAVGVAGVLIEGSIGIGILVAGVTGTVMTVNQLKGDEKRVLTLGETGSDCKVVLVRPNVIVDPEWEQITAAIRQEAPNDRRPDIFPFFAGSRSEKKERQRRDQDIVSSEDELDTNEKIFLLVASSLNDKDSLPGYVYRRLSEEVKSRAMKRKEDSKAVHDPRAVRQDVHGIIKYITATLLEVRPGFGSSPSLTEISATSVETLVFGEVYNMVFEEIVSETHELDLNLRNKFSQVQKEAVHKGIDTEKLISEDAVQSIRLLSTYHSVSEKLRCCVHLLESVSKLGSECNMGADNLLKLVCQHLVKANVSHLNAECVFLEEFASDEQLIQGKEGYALVTMQASLHFLNSTSIETLLDDVFGEDVT